MSALRIGTRGSALALAQSGWVAEQLGGELVVLRTSGDDGVSGDKARWVDTIEAALVAGEIDLAVHSAKDVPGELAEGTAILATPPREDPADLLIGGPLDALAAGAVVGTASLRRSAQILAARPDLHVTELRGNVDTRLRKWSEGEADAIVLALAGLKRIGRAPDGASAEPDVGWTGAPLAGEVFVPAPGQGVLAIQGRLGDERLCEAVNDPLTFTCLEAEREAAMALGASCHTAVGIYADGARMRGFAGRPDGSEWVVDEIEGLDGALLGERMLAAGAREILAA